MGNRALAAEGLSEAAVPDRRADAGVTVIAFDARKTRVPMPHGSGIYVRRLFDALRLSPPPDHELWGLEEGGRLPELWWEQVTLPRLLRRRGAGLLHCPDSFLPLRRRCPGVLTIHDLAFAAMPSDMLGKTGWKYRTFVPHCARSAERVICPSRFTADDLVARFGVEPDRVRVIPEAPALAMGSLAPPAGPYLLSAGDLRPKKNLSLLVEAYRLLRRQGLQHQLVLPGLDVGMARELARLAGKEPLELPGFVSDAQLDALIRGAEAVIVPSLYEGFGLIVLEAMARSSPVVLARAGALPEVGGSAATYFDPHDVEGLAEAIRRVVEDRSERMRMCEAGRAHAARYTWERTAAATVEVYEELLG